MDEAGFPRSAEALPGNVSEPPKGEPDIRLETTAGDEVKAWCLEAEEKVKKLYVVSEGRKKTEDSNLEAQRKRFEEGLAKPRGGLRVKGRMKQRDKLLESVGRLKQKYSRMARQDSNPGAEQTNI